MIDRFKQYIEQERLFKPKDKILLTISGGIDSMTMLDLFVKMGYNFSIAHCNFNLRNVESDGDQEFVQRYAHKHKTEVFVKSFDTKGIAEKEKISIQMAARDLRYNWFHKLAIEQDFDKIAVAHNLNDIVETFFINLTRGSGIKGLTGIKPKQGIVVRPLLFAKRTEIKRYAIENKIGYREDSSNAETKYMRNAIRHKIIPEFETLNPSFLEAVIHTTNILKSANKTWNKHIGEHKETLIKSCNDNWHINIEELKNSKVNPTELYELLHPYGFTYDTTNKILPATEDIPGKVFYSSTHKLVVDRDNLIISGLAPHDTEEYLLEENEKQITSPIKLKFEKQEITNNFSIIRNRSVATFDAEKIKYPLKLRRWKLGDVFHPFGMKGRKKLSDYFTDQKMSIIDKEKVWLLVSGEDIVWIVNHRTDNRYKVTNATKKVLQVEFTR